ncbi:MAG: proline--tRNA ligase [Clostridiales bacterium]|nr:proline--tRNA ligase [Clostridiales bacterium]
MRMSQIYAPTLRETPAEAEIISHQLMMKAGLIRKVAAGIYTYLPLGWRSMKKIMDIIREEMDAAGGQELFMPTVHPAELWLESGRWQIYGAELWRVKDRHERDFCLAPTHEEVITSHIRNDIRSYKQLPQRPYQIQTKFRDERRPRFGLMRGREFIMKDMYSFDKDENGLENSYQLLHQAYTNIFSRCGLTFRPVQADSGAIGGKGSHEFMALAKSGESEIVYCHNCEYAASTEIAPLVPSGTGKGEELRRRREVETPDCKTVEDVAVFLGVPSDRMVKSMCYWVLHKDETEEVLLVLIRGDRQINEIKLKNTLDCLELRFATEEEVRRIGMEPGYCGPVGLRSGVRIVADAEVPLMVNHECGGGRKDFHYLDVNFIHDYHADIIADIALVQKGCPCPNCGNSLDAARGIEVGQIFKLHTKYSSVLGARYVDEQGLEHDMVMGCYGIGVGRTMGAVIEQHHDEHGIIWPMSVAPYQISIVPVNDKDSELMTKAIKLYEDLLKAKVEAVLDDRHERPGVKFNDADLLGFPLRLTLGRKTAESGMVELRIRKTGEVRELPLNEAVDIINATIIEMMEDV